MRGQWISFSVFLACGLQAAELPRTAPLFDAIRRADTAAVKRLLDGGASPDAVDADGIPALHSAALFAQADCLKLLLDRGANANAAASDGATALMWSMPDVEKARLLIAHKAAVNARSGPLGRTPLLIAAGYVGSVPVLRLLLEKGADLRARDARGDHALLRAVRSADVEVVRFLVERGLDVNYPGNGARPLGRALPRQYRPTIDYLISKGAEAGKSDLTGATATQDLQLIEKVLAMGVDVNARNSTFGRTPLIYAAASELSSPATLKLLLAKGADPNIADSDGETALDWAMHRSDQARIDILRQHGGKEGSTPRDKTFPPPEGVGDARTSLARSVALLLPTAAVPFQKRACITCHTQSMPQQVAAAAREAGVPFNEDLAKKNLQQIRGVYKPLGREYMLGAETGGGDLTVGYIVMALAAEKLPLDHMTAALTHGALSRQMPDGSWPEGTSRPPMEYSTVSRTAMAVRIIAAYPIPGRQAQIDAALSRARAWLTSVKPQSAEESAMRLAALAWTKAPRPDLDAASAGLISGQRGDGGWAQLPHLGTDAYATGIALFALHEAGIPVTHEAYRKGVAWLLRNQYADGSWFVKTRSFPVQPQFESGYPFGYNQWISSAGASWASLAIAHTITPAR